MKVDWKDAVLLGAVMIAVCTDLRTGLIRNWLTAPLFLGGLVAAFFSGGWGETLSSVAVSAGCAYMTFLFARPGGGDLKLALAAGPWVGPQGFGLYLFGAWLTRAFLNFLVRLKIHGWNPVAAVRDAAIELRTWQVPRFGKNSFRIFQEAAAKVGGDPDLPAVPGALWVAGGVISLIFFKGVII